MCRCAIPLEGGARWHSVSFERLHERKRIMDRRKLFGVLAAALAGLAAWPGNATAAEDKDHGDARDRCAKACADCVVECAGRRCDSTRRLRGVTRAGDAPGRSRLVIRQEKLG